jgi:hypothetical protein
MEACLRRLWNLAVVLKGRQAGCFFPKTQPLPSQTLFLDFYS